MNNERAIAWLEDEKIEAICDDATTDDEWIDVLELAIEALNKEEKVLKALEDVRAEIETDRRDSCRTDFGEGVQYELNQVLGIIDCKIREIKHE